ncbi:MAG: enoyl-CoA hydratase/isomerase family protein [Casimicrobiaceae bacterium]
MGSPVAGNVAGHSGGVVLVEQQDGVAILTINRPDKLNALNPAVFAALHSILDALEKEASVKVLIFTGQGEKAFVAGADIEQLATMDTVDAFEQMTSGHRLFLRISEFPKPTIAMVNGYALGGGFELALSCDMLVASEGAVFGFPEINLDTLPGWGGTQLAPRKMGSNRAREMVLTGNHYAAADCRNFGFINRLVPARELRTTTLELAASLATKNSFALKMAKSALQHADGLDLSAGMRYETLAYATNFSAPHAKAGLKAFLSRKKPGSSR